MTCMTANDKEKKKKNTHGKQNIFVVSATCQI